VIAQISPKFLSYKRIYKVYPIFLHITTKFNNSPCLAAGGSCHCKKSKNTSDYNPSTTSPAIALRAPQVCGGITTTEQI